MLLMVLDASVLCWEPFIKAHIFTISAGNITCHCLMMISFRWNSPLLQRTALCKVIPHSRDCLFLNERLMCRYKGSTFLLNWETLKVHLSTTKPTKMTCWGFSCSCIAGHLLFLTSLSSSILSDISSESSFQ